MVSNKSFFLTSILILSANLSVPDFISERILFSFTAKKFLQKRGLKISPAPNGEHLKIITLIRKNAIDLVLDVGANEGQYGGYLRSIGYQGQIVSFEPLDAAFKILEQKANADKLWSCRHIALGNISGESVINVSGNSQSSSILNIKGAHLDAAPEADFLTNQKIMVEKLDDIYNDITAGKPNVMLKLDVQGFEKFVLEGAKKSLKKLKGIQVEMSFEELYDGEMLYREMIDFLGQNGFVLCALKNGFHNVNTGKLLQADGFFFKI